MSQSQKKTFSHSYPRHNLELLKFLLPKRASKTTLATEKVTLHSIARRALDIGLDMMQKKSLRNIYDRKIYSTI